MATIADDTGSLQRQNFLYMKYLNAVRAQSLLIARAARNTRTLTRMQSFKVLKHVVQE